MFHAITFRGALAVGLVGLAVILSDSSVLLSRAEAGPVSTARHILLRREHQLERQEQVNRQQLHREQRQVSHIRRELNQLRPTMHTMPKKIR